jgi:glycolate oxidase FAD binding subunit
MIAPDQLEALRDAVGEGGLQEHGPVELDGVAVALTLSPPDGEALSRTLAVLRRHGLAVAVCGGGSSAGAGNLPTDLDAFLSTRRLVGIEEFDASDGVCHVRSGTPVREVREALVASGWELSLDPPGRNATIGGCLAAASIGPRSLGLGLPRDQLLGLTVSLTSGERVHCGGRVVKNVTGYDLNKLYTGSFGTLGVIESAWLRLRACPERSASCEIRTIHVEGICRSAISAARCVSARAAAIASDRATGWKLVVELAGDAPTVERDLAWLREEHSASDSPDGAIEPIRDLQAQVPTPLGLRFRIGVLPSRLEAALVELRHGGAALLAYPGLRLAYASFALDASLDEREVAAIFRNVESVARGAGGGFVCESAPTFVKAGRDMFGDLGSSGAIARALKQRFDPTGVLNPGRFAGRHGSTSEPRRIDPCTTGAA